MNLGDLLALSPLLALAATPVVVMLAAAVRCHHRVTVALTLAGLAVAGAALAFAWPLAPHPVAALLMIDRYALFFMGLIVTAAFAVTLFASDDLERRGGADADRRPETFHILLILATTGAAVLVAAVHFVSFFLGLELLGISLYALVGYRRDNRQGIEAGLKYLILAGVSGAFVLFGLALIYAESGTLEFGRLDMFEARAGGLLTPAGVGLIVVGIGFKLSLAPFHLWAPDVYQGAPAPVAAFVATVSKGAVFALLLRILPPDLLQRNDSLTLIFTLIAIASMFVGNGLALLQNNVKRLLAYSSIAHMGYLLVAFLAGGPWATAAVMAYLTAYFVTTLGAFGVVSVLSTGGKDADAPEDYRGLAWRRPWVAGVFSAMLLSLAGIPLTAGFIGKFYVLAAGVSASRWLLVLSLVLNSAIGLFYYLRLMALLYRAPADAAPGAAETASRDLPAAPTLRPPPILRPRSLGESGGAPARNAARSASHSTAGGALQAGGRLPFLSGAALLVLTLALLALGMYPAPLIALIRLAGAP